MKIKGIIFDFDGVIVDSEYIFLKGVLEYLRKIGIETCLQDIKYIIGKKEYQIAKDLREQFNLSKSIEQIKEDFSDDEWLNADVESLDKMPGLINFLKYSIEQKWVLAIASSSKYDYVYRILKRFNIEQYFKVLLTGDMVNNGKPDPEIYFKVLELLNLPKENVVVLEDSFNGIKSAKTAGIYTIGFKGSELLQDTKMADAEVGSYEELYKLISKLQRRT